jgi:heme/copper-type cytochrome/quinol oxidase subunit 2
VATRDELVDALDHPIFFSLVITLVVVAWMAIFTWAFKAMNLPGPAHLFQTP